MNKIKYETLWGKLGKVREHIKSNLSHSVRRDRVFR